MKKNRLLYVVIVVILLSSCSGSNVNHEIEYLPFQESKDGNWGLISPSGEVLFSEEFSNVPTVAVNGRFMVKNSDGLWEIYTTDKKPKRIGGEYLQAGLFFADVAPVVEKDQPIKLTDKNGDVKVVLDKIEGKFVEECGNFIGGLARVLVDGYWGAINPEGKLVIAPEFINLEISEHGNLLGVSNKYQNETNDEKICYTVLSRNGKEISELKKTEFSAIDDVGITSILSGAVLDDGVIVSPKKGESLSRGIMGFDGEWILQPPSNKVLFLQEVRGNNLIFNNGHEEYGVVNKKGEEIIRAKYSKLMFGSDDVLIGRKSGKKGYGLYSINDTKIADEEYEFIYRSFDGQHFFAQNNGNDYVILDKEGKEQKLKTDIYNIMLNMGDSELQSDFFDIDGIVSVLRIGKDGFYGLTTELTGPQAIDIVNGLEGNANMSKEARMYNSSGSDLGGFLTRRHYNSYLFIAREGLIKETKGSGNYYSPFDYSWTDNKICGFYCYMGTSFSDKLDGKMELFSSKLIAAVKECGKIVKEGKHAVIVDVGDSKSYYVCWIGKDVHLYYGKFDLVNIDVNKYNDITEKDDVSDGRPIIIGSKQETYADEDDYGDYGELGSPPADDL